MLCDFNIAGFEGLQVLEAVRTFDPRYCSLFTGTGSEEMQSAIKHGASDYVLKRPKYPETAANHLCRTRKKRIKRPASSCRNRSSRDEERYKEILENALVGIDQVTGDGKIVIKKW